MIALLLGLMACRIDYFLNDEDSAVVPPVSVSESFEQAALVGVDVLFVVDGTGSMVEEQASLAAAAVRFVDALSTLEVAWQVGVTTMDPADDGVLRGRPWILTSRTPDVAAVFAASVSLGGDGLPPAAGIATAMAAIVNSSGQNTGFRRDNTALHVVFVSDDDDASDAALDGDPVTELLALLSDEAARTGQSARVSAVVGDVPSGCAGAGGAARPGERYVQLVEATDGLFASICAADFGDIAAALGEEGIDWPTRFPLQAVPAAGSVVVTVDGIRASSGWELDGDTVVFATAPAPGALIVVEYQLVAGA